jgi:aspartate ammonia-lyase
MPPPIRTERDLVGAIDLPAGCSHGIHTARALENFPGERRRVADVAQFCRALGMVKLSALRANIECGVVSGEVASALGCACEELADGRSEICQRLVVPILQGGAGTSTNMNVNEVLANRALELLGQPLGAYEHCHPNDHVNRSQSTNDVYPTALGVALVLRDQELVCPALELLTAALRSAARRFAGVAKLGRTQLQDAVPMTVDQEIDAWADAVENASRGLSDTHAAVLVVNLGGTAIGTGLAAPACYQRVVVAHLADVSRLEVRSAQRPVSATSDPSRWLAFSSALRTCGIALAKICNDLRLLASGPRAGLAEYRLPARQAGSSMMPGKVNPVICEYVNQVAFRIRGLDATATFALDAGQLQLNAMLPAVADALFEAQELLAGAARLLADRCIDGLAIDERRMSSAVGLGLGSVTELAAHAGYEAATEIASGTGQESVAQDEGHRLQPSADGGPRSAA